MDHIKKSQRKVHPREKNSFISNIFFIYAIKLFQKGFKKDLQEDDLYDVLSSHRSKKLGDQLEKEWENQKSKRKNLSVVRLMITCYGVYYIYLGFVQVFINLTEIPYALGKLVAYFTPGQATISKEEAYMYAAAVLGLNFFQCVYKHNYFLMLASFGVKCRAAFCSFMYRKALKLSPAYLGNISIGKIVTLITKDVETFEMFINFGNDIWIGFIKTFVVAVSLYAKIGVSALVGVGFFLIVMPLQIILGLKLKKMRLRMCKRTDERLQLTQETLSAIRIVKMYTWELFFNRNISAARKKELYETYKMFYWRFIILTIGSLSSHCAFYLMIMSYVWFGNKISAEIVYFTMSTYHSMSYGLSVLFPVGVYRTAELHSAIKRMGQMLKAPEVQRTVNGTISKSTKIQLKDVTVLLQDIKILKNISITFEKGLNLIAGQVGSGKSFLLKTILQDYTPEEGTLSIDGTISYASQEPWLFPSSIKQNILFGEEYNEKRYNQVLKVCALIYDFELLENGDSTIVEDRGINLSKGQQARINLARAVYKESEIYLLDDPLAALDAHVSAFIFKECMLEFLKDKLVILVSNNIKHIKNADKAIVIKNGTIDKVGKMVEYYENEVTEEPAKEDNNKEEKEEDESGTEESKLITETTTERKVYQEVMKKGEVNTSIYNKYITFGGGYCFLFLVFCVFVTAQLSNSYTDKLVSEWVNIEELSANLSDSNSTNRSSIEEKRQFVLIMYSTGTLAAALTYLARAVALMVFAKVAASNLHKIMISTIISAKMEFFDRNFIGNILNRFSKDLLILDDQVPFSIYHVFNVFLQVVGIVTLIATVNSTFLIPATVFFAILVLLRTYCLRTSRSLKRLDVSTRSPLVGHLNATLEGLTTIRAFKAENILKDEFDKHQDLYTSATYVFYCSMRAFAFTLDTLCGFFISTIVLKFFVTDNAILAGHVGLAISQAFSLTGTLQWGIRQWAEVENKMTSVERVLEYTDVKTENMQGLKLPNWPNLGEIKYESVFLTYTNSKDYVLKNITFAVSPKEKVGVVGRTGAGKSSIISTLFRLYDVEGKILIDGVDTKTIALDYLRSNISIIPQDPVVFTGTIRDNIDPLQKYTDEEIWKVIQLAHLKPLIPSLDTEIVENGSNFSIGQRQLICLARAIIQGNKIIVLDEATANMDPETDELIRKTIEENFQNCTVFTIAHKLQSILRSDKVMVMEKGEIIEYNAPNILLKDKEGMFYKMVEKAGLLPEKL